MWRGAVLRAESVWGFMLDMTRVMQSSLLASVRLAMESNTKSDRCPVALAIARMTLWLNWIK